MITLISAAILSLHAGDVCTLKASTSLVQPGKLNWALRDPSFVLACDTRVIIQRTNPDQISGVIEVKLYDGSNRLGWVEDIGVNSLASELNFKPIAKRTDDGTFSPNYGLPSGLAPRPVRVRRLPDFTAVDGAINSIGQATFAQIEAQRQQSIIAAQMRQGAAMPPALMAASGGGISRGYYVGARQPSGQYVGGINGGRLGSTYKNPYTGDRYQKRTSP